MDIQEQAVLKKRALGKGLSALIPEKGVSIEPTDELGSSGILYLEVDKIKPNLHQPREEFDSASLEELASSIKEKGFIQPIIVRRSKDGYELIAGERRLRAAKSLKINKIPSIIRNADDDESLEIALIENVQREGLNPIEEARAYQRLISNFNLTQEQISQQVGKARASVANTLRLLKLPSDIQEKIRKGLISFAQGKLLLEIENPRKQMKLVKKIIEKGLSIRELENLLRGQTEGKIRRSTQEKKDNEVIAEEEKLQQILGTKVRININRKRGTVVIEFYSLEDLDRILVVLKKQR